MNKSFDKIIGYSEIKKELDRICDMMNEPGAYRALGARLPRGVLLYGDPGLGKTLAARCLIEGSGWPVLSCRKAGQKDLCEEIRAVFDAAEKEERAIVFLDDMDKFSNEDMDLCDSDEYVTVQGCIDQLKNPDVLVLATVNNIYKLPESLLRTGRFDRKFRFMPPAGKDAERITEYYLKDKPMAEDLDAAGLARLLHGKSCSDLETVINEAAILAASQRKTAINMDDLVEAVLRVIYRFPSAESCKEADPGEVRRIAVHEAGHVTVREALEPGSVTMAAVRLQPDGRNGITTCCPRDEGSISEDLENDIIAALGGLAASEIVFGSSDMGSSEDIDHAFALVTSLLTDSCTKGFSLHGLVHERPSEALKSRQEDAIARDIEVYYRKAKALILQNRSLLDKVAEKLMRNTVVTAQDIEGFGEENPENFSEVRPAEPSDANLKKTAGY